VFFTLEGSRGPAVWRAWYISLEDGKSNDKIWVANRPMPGWCGLSTVSLSTCRPFIHINEESKPGRVSTRKLRTPKLLTRLLPLTSTSRFAHLCRSRPRGPVREQAGAPGQLLFDLR